MDLPSIRRAQPSEEVGRIVDIRVQRREGVQELVHPVLGDDTIRTGDGFQRALGSDQVLLGHQAVHDADDEVPALLEARSEVQLLHPVGPFEPLADVLLGVPVTRHPTRDLLLVPRPVGAGRAGPTEGVAHVLEHGLAVDLAGLDARSGRRIPHPVVDLRGGMELGGRHRLVGERRHRGVRVLGHEAPGEVHDVVLEAVLAPEPLDQVGTALLEGLPRCQFLDDVLLDIGDAPQQRGAQGGLPDADAQPVGLGRLPRIGQTVTDGEVDRCPEVEQHPVRQRAILGHRIRGLVQPLEQGRQRGVVGDARLAEFLDADLCRRGADGDLAVGPEEVAAATREHGEMPSQRVERHALDGARTERPHPLHGGEVPGPTDRVLQRPRAGRQLVDARHQRCAVRDPTAQGHTLDDALGSRAGDTEGEEVHGVHDHPTGEIHQRVVRDGTLREVVDAPLPGLHRRGVLGGEPTLCGDLSQFTDRQVARETTRRGEPRGQTVHLVAVGLPVVVGQCARHPRVRKGGEQATGPLDGVADRLCATGQHIAKDGDAAEGVASLVDEALVLRLGLADLVQRGEGAVVDVPRSRRRGLDALDSEAREVDTTEGRGGSRGLGPR